MEKYFLQIQTVHIRDFLRCKGVIEPQAKLRLKDFNQYLVKTLKLKNKKPARSTAEILDVWEKHVEESAGFTKKIPIQTIFGFWRGFPTEGILNFSWLKIPEGRGIFWLENSDMCHSSEKETTILFEFPCTYYNM